MKCRFQLKTEANPAAVPDWKHNFPPAFGLETTWMGGHWGAPGAAGMGIHTNAA